MAVCSALFPFFIRLVSKKSRKDQVWKMHFMIESSSSSSSSSSSKI